jgi:hypothetical protein
MLGQVEHKDLSAHEVCGYDPRKPAGKLPVIDE